MTNTLIPLPAGHTELYEWRDDKGQPVRDFKGSSWPFEVGDYDGTRRDLAVTIHGWQQLQLDGTGWATVRQIVFDDTVLCMDEARQLAAALLAAADDVERNYEADRLSVPGEMVTA